MNSTDAPSSPENVPPAPTTLETPAPIPPPASAPPPQSPTPTETPPSPPQHASFSPPPETPPQFEARLGFPGKIATHIATLGPLGMRMTAPGTWGSGAGLLLYSVVFARYNNLAGWATYLGLAVALIATAIVVCHIAEKHLGRKDPGQIIFDEFAAMPLVFIGAESFLQGAGNYGWAWFFGGLVLFRIFDILKPFGIKRLQNLPGGLGVVVDDLAAAALACGVLHVLHLGVGLFGG